MYRRYGNYSGEFSERYDLGNLLEPRYFKVPFESGLVKAKPFQVLFGSYLPVGHFPALLFCERA